MSSSSSSSASTSSQPSETIQAQSQTPQAQTAQPSKKSLIPNSTKLLLGGTAFLILSSIITRRALLRKRISALPPTYTSAPFHQPPVNGALEALEALNIATINVASVAMIGVGAGMYAFDINTMEDLRRKVRGGLGVDGSGRSEQDVEEELEEWVVSVLGRKAEKEKKGKEGQREYVNERGKER
ncbi:hypothetical protein AJ78_02335 [Emergomyces pasteurianus Ep9510]|uniref:Altered inheritance of mitochondria protein 11 n=1 Tax=Emergomyces pasteurianus Ep9510 TaxID=1447872 RepID=A0A1J9PM49_9EURO|nr:hypothetical protein AJ78_02335 [Emergomyces pasteurianus Ep9510]